MKDWELEALHLMDEEEFIKNIHKELEGGKNNMGVDKQPDLDKYLNDWTAFAGDYIKPEFVKSWPAEFVVKDVMVATEDGRIKLILEINYLGRSWNFDLNKTNQSFIRAKKLMPKDLKNKTLICDKTKVRNPSTGNQVDSLIIVDIK